jgi:hypothetical protein
MLGLALQARIPLVSATTTDLINLSTVLQCYAPGKVLETSHTSAVITDTVYWTTMDMTIDQSVLSRYLEKNSTLLLINQPNPDMLAFDAGEVPVPLPLLEKYIGMATDNVAEYLRLAAGLTIKQTVEVIKLTKAKDNKLTPAGFRYIRGLVAGNQQGLSQVNPEYDFYIANTGLALWSDRNKNYFREPKDTRLVPRGLLFSGPPGTGKTMGAKYLANEWGVPLYRLDMGSSLGKYVGESEGNLSRILATVDREEPCILLIDEVEKLFAERDDSGVTSRLLGQLLWWLQEHTSRVLTVMTTNDRTILPPELIRSGRIDKDIYMGCLKVTEGLDFAERVLAEFIPHVNTTAPNNQSPVPTTNTYRDWLVHDIKTIYQNTETQIVAHADLIALVHDLIKARNWV